MDLQKVRAYVCPVTAHQGVINTIKDRIVAAGGTLVGADDTDFSEASERVAACDVVVILICAETQNSPEIEAVVEVAARLGKRVIGIWLDAEVGQGVPAWLEREGDAAIQATPEMIVAAIINDEKLWALPSGEPRPIQKTPRHHGKKR